MRPLAESGLFRGRRRGTEVPRSGRQVSRSWRAQRALGRREAVRGNRGNPGLGAGRVFPRCSHIPGPEGAARHARMPRTARRPGHLPGPLHGGNPSWFAPSTVTGAAGTVISEGGRRGLGEPGTGAVIFRGRGRFRVPPAIPDWYPSCQFVRSGAGVILTSAARSGVRSGSRKRNAATASVLVEGLLASVVGAYRPPQPMAQSTSAEQLLSCQKLLQRNYANLYSTNLSEWHVDSVERGG